MPAPAHFIRPPGFDRFMAEFVTELPSPEDLEKLLTIAPQYGIVILPPAH